MKEVVLSRNIYLAPAVKVIAVSARQMLCNSVTDSKVNPELGDGDVE